MALGLAGVLAFVSPAQAQDANSGKGGFWAGAVVGAEKANLGRKKEKPVYGAAAGYDFAVSGALLGVEIEASDSSSGGCSHQVDDDGDRLCYKAGRDLYAGLRAGAFVIPDLLIYAKGGYVNGARRVDHEDDVCCHINETEKLRGSGWRVGAGLERDFGGAYLRVEYRYTDYAGSYSKHQAVAGVGLRF
jgi:outer membrane immunogenic protein